MEIDRTTVGLLIELAAEAETALLARALARVAVPGTVIGLEGPLGAGKTRLVRAFAEELGVDPSEIGSPTFVLIHEYDGRLPIYHFDTYRLPDADAFEALGVADYFASDGVCLIEWADRVEQLLPLRTWRLRLQIAGETSRAAHLWGDGPWDSLIRAIEELRQSSSALEF